MTAETGKAVRDAVDMYERALQEHADAIEHELRNNPEAAAELANSVLESVKVFLNRLF
jgi:hypothetical protein